MSQRITTASFQIQAIETACSWASAARYQSKPNWFPDGSSVVPGGSAPNSRSPAVARRLPRLTTSRRERCATAVSRHAFVSSARGWWCADVRAATSVRRAGVLPKCAVGLPRAVGGCEGADGTLGHAGGAVRWSRPALSRCRQLRGGNVLPRNRPFR